MARTPGKSGKPTAKRKPLPAGRQGPAKAAAPRAKRKPTQNDSPQTGSLRIEQLAEMLRVPAETIRSHVTDGAPVDRSGRSPRINLVHYAAWLIRRLQSACLPAGRLKDDT